MHKVWPRVFVTEQAAGYPRCNDLLERLTACEVVSVPGDRHPGNGLLIAVNKGSFIKPCPGQKGSVCCGYWVVEWGLGCPLGCAYCVLQTYLPKTDMILYINLEDCWHELRQLRATQSGVIRLGTGQFSDPLAMETVFPFHVELSRVVATLPDVFVEIKSKSGELGPLTELSAPERFIIAFSLASEIITTTFEAATATLQQRLETARKAQDMGFAVAFHFDPIIPTADWKSGYQKVFEQMRQILRADNVRWISLGTFRFPAGFAARQVAIDASPGLFDEEWHPSFDGKMRYFRPLREEIYSFCRPRLAEIFPQTAIYLCMEASYVWERVTGQAMHSRQLRQMLDATLT